MLSRKNVSSLLSLMMCSSLALFTVSPVFSSDLEKDPEGKALSFVPAAAGGGSQVYESPSLLTEEEIAKAETFSLGALLTPSEAKTTEFIKKQGLDLMTKGGTEASGKLPPRLGLSIDGGGIRGVMPALWLKTLKETYADEKEYGIDAPLYKIFDYVGGTSIGGIVSLGVAANIEPSTMVGLFENKENRENIFSAEGRRVARFFDFLGLIGHRYSANKLEELLKTTFGESKTLSDLKTNILITACTTAGHPWLFKKDKDPLKNYKLWEVARSTSAAPTYFDAYPLQFPIRQDGLYPTLVDGGIWANNPSTLVTASLVKEFFNGKFNPDKIHLLSFGTGDTHAQGIWQSAGKLSAGAIIEALMNSHSRGNHILMEQLLGDHYHRVNVDMPKAIDLADTSPAAYAQMKAYANQEQAKGKIKKFVDDTASIVRKKLEGNDETA